MSRFCLLCAAALWHRGAEPLGATSRGPTPAPPRSSGGRSDLPVPSKDTQAFLDHFPVTRFVGFDFHPWVFGSSDLNASSGAGGGRLPAFLRRFDVRFGFKPEEELTAESRTVLANPSRVKQLLAAAVQRLDPARRDSRVLLLGNSEVPLSEALGWGPVERALTIRGLRAYFGAVYAEFTDVRIEGVKTMPIGLTEHYLREGRAEAARAAYAAAELRPAEASGGGGGKSRGVLAAYGTTPWGGVPHRGPYAGLPLIKGLLSRRWASCANEALRSRAEADEWSASAEAKEAGVERREVPHDVWFQELAKYRFLISPIGTAIQGAKAVEALLLLTVPIAQRGPYGTFDDLAALGFPLVIVEHWAEITRGSLDHWWAELSPRLLSFRRDCLTTEGYWKLLTEGGCAAAPAAPRGAGGAGAGASAA